MLAMCPIVVCCQDEQWQEQQGREKGADGEGTGGKREGSSESYLDGESNEQCSIRLREKNYVCLDLCVRKFMCAEYH